MTVQRFQVFGWANPVEGGDGPFGGIFVKESDYDALAAQLVAMTADRDLFRNLFMGRPPGAADSAVSASAERE